MDGPLALLPLPVRRGLVTGAWAALFLACLGSAVRALSLVSLDVAVFPEPFRTSYAPIAPVVAVHAAAGVLTLAALPWLLHPWLRTRALGAHRWLGRVYLLAVLAGGCSGLWMATRAQGGLAGQLGFTALALAWLTTGALGWRAARAGRVEAHRRWMIRNGALTLAAVTLRAQLFVATLCGLPLALGYPWIAWLAWLPNWLLAETLLALAGRVR